MEYELNFGNNKDEATRVVNYLNFKSGLKNIKAELIGHYPIFYAPYRVRFQLDEYQNLVRKILKDGVNISDEIIETLVSKE
jgi:hypothetical protein